VAAAAAVAGICLLVMERHAPIAFADVLQKVRDAKSVSFVCTQKILSGPTLEQMWFMQDDVMRMEMPGQQPAFQGKIKEPVVLAIIGDLKQETALQLDFVQKIAKWLPINKNMEKQFINPVEQLRQLKDQDADRMPDEILDGLQTQVYHLKKVDFFGGKGKIEEGEIFKLWVDAKTGLPVRIALESWGTDKKGKISLVFYHFKWNEPLAPEMFRLDVPAGFKVE
jgi:outer membrane lipoprotein-sorting protein